MDGRRIVTNAYGSRTVSLNSVPTGMVDRVEVITGGSSAAYGSDAVAGIGTTAISSDARFANILTGWSTSMSIQVNNANNLCNAPIEPSDNNPNT